VQLATVSLDKTIDKPVQMNSSVISEQNNLDVKAHGLTSKSPMTQARNSCFTEINAAIKDAATDTLLNEFSNNHQELGDLEQPPCISNTPIPLGA
jgi:hypothetical protein